MNIFLTIFAIFFICLIGYLIIIGFRLLPKEKKLLAFACSYGFGIGLIALQLYIYARIRIPWELLYIFSPWVILGTFLLIRFKERFLISKMRLPNLSIMEISLIVGSLCSFGYTVFEALIRPVTAWDSWVTWLLKSKVFFINGTITPELLNYVKVNYPLVINLLGTFIYLVIGNVDDTAVLLTSTAFYAFTALLLFSSLKQYGLRYALLFTFLLVTTQNFVRHGGRFEAGLADLPLGYFAFASVLILFEYLKKYSWKTFLLLTIFLGITSLIKYEGIVISLVIGCYAGFMIIRKQYYSHLLLMVFWGFPVIDWFFYQKYYHLKDSYFSSHQVHITTFKTINAITGTIKELLNIKSWNLLWIIYFYSLYSSFIKKVTNTFILHFIIISQICLYIGMFIFTAANNPEGSIERLLMHVAPLAFYAIAISNMKLFPQRFAIIDLNERKKSKKRNKNRR